MAYSLSRFLLSSLNENCYFPEVEKTISMISSAENKCSSGSNAAIRGIEGSTSRMYFSALSFFIDKKFGFSGRNRRPPRDCANAALSYSYSVLYNSVDVILRNHGFDTFVGFMHTSQSGHRALASDMMEIFRPICQTRAGKSLSPALKKRYLLLRLLLMDMSRAAGGLCCTMRICCLPLLITKMFHVLIHI